MKTDINKNLEILKADTGTNRATGKKGDGKKVDLSKYLDDDSNPLASKSDEELNKELNILLTMDNNGGMLANNIMAELDRRHGKGGEERKDTVKKAIDLLSGDLLEKGSTSNHKYLEIKDGRYIYDHSKMSAQDHLEASNFHHKKAKATYSSEGRRNASDAEADHHWEQKFEHEKLAKEKEGEQVGYTKTGDKLVYDKFDHPSHKDFTMEDHKEAADLHDDRANSAEEESIGHARGGETSGGNEGAMNKWSKIASNHKEQAAKHRQAAKLKS